MVEGHSVHRVATRFRQRLVGQKFVASSPNGRFVNGAAAVNDKPLTRMEAVGKNLFAFFDNEVVHVHFGMAGAWAIYETSEEIPEPTKTTRLRLENAQYVTHLSAMTVQHGDMDLYLSKKKALGQDPLREDANPELLWNKVKASKKSIGALIMDQSYFCGPGNIYRAEILFKAGVHPNIAGQELTKSEFDRVWYHTVALLQRGYQTGSILTVDPEEAVALGKPKLRRYIYNSSKCPRCQTAIVTWPINNRTCYACPKCQPLSRKIKAEPTTTEPCQPFHSHCAREPLASRMADGGPSRLTVKEIKQELTRLGIEYKSSAKKAALVELLQDSFALTTPQPATTKPAVVTPMKSSEEAALEKAHANESLAVEHIAELGPDQARKARRNLDFDDKKKKKKRKRSSN